MTVEPDEDLGAAPESPDGPRDPVLVRRWTTGTASRSTAITLAATVVIIALQLVTGVLTARLLLPEGRGELAAILAWVMTGPALLSFGAPEGPGYFQARAPSPRPDAVGAALLATAFMTVSSFVAAQLLVGVAFSGENADIIGLARWGFTGVSAFALFTVLQGQLNACGFFLLSNVARAAQPLLYLLGVLGSWAFSAVTTATVLVSMLVSYLVVGVYQLVILLQAVGVTRPTRHFVDQAWQWGLRAYGQTLGQVGNSRLDLMLLPAFVAAPQIGLYAVAVNIASLPVTIFGRLQQVTYREAAQRTGEDGRLFIERMLRFVVVGSVVVVVPLAVLAEVVLGVMYGEEFTEAAPAMRWVLPGLIAWAGNGVLTSSLRALGRPWVASRHQLIGLVLTVVLLLVMLPTLGIVGAAIASSVVYVLVFVANAASARSVGALQVRSLLSVSELRTECDVLARRLLATARRR